jgi:hypothetical protein
MKHLYALTWALLLFLHCGPSETEEGEVVRLTGDTVEVPAVVAKAGFEEDSPMPGYHFLVWEKGRSADHALFITKATDVEVLDALEALGAVAGNALDTDSWDERKDRSSKAPDKVIEGPAVELLVRIPGAERPLSMDEVLVDPGGKGFEMRFGGHRANIPKWKSGCVVCLYSCPGSKVGNASYTIRDFVDGATRFRVRPGALPNDGTEVTILFRLVEEAATP